MYAAGYPCENNEINMSILTFVHLPRFRPVSDLALRDEMHARSCGFDRARPPSLHRDEGR